MPSEVGSRLVGSPGSRAWPLVGALLACAWQVSFSAPAFAEQAPPPPAISVEEPVYDFGKVPEGGAIRHVFKVKNIGGTPLEIKSVSAACGCTAAAPKEKQIAPGRTSEIEVQFDTRNRPGRNEKTVTVVSNDPKTPSLTLLIRAEVEQLLSFDPPFTRLGTGKDEAPTAEVWLTGKLAARARPRIVKIEPAGGAAKIAVIDKAQGALKRRGLRITVDPTRLGQGSARVVVATGLAQPAQIEHFVSWNVSGNIEAPRQVHLDLAQPASRERIIQITSRRSDFRLRGARVVEGPFEATLLPPTGAGQPSIKLTTKLTTPPATFTQGKLLLESNDPLEPKKEVTLSLAPGPQKK